MTDIARDPAILRRKRIRQAALVAVGAVVLVGVTVGLSRMEPAAPSVERATVLEDTVKRARHYGSIAKDALALFPDSTMKTALVEAVDFAIGRSS